MILLQYCWQYQQEIIFLLQPCIFFLTDIKLGSLINTRQSHFAIEPFKITPTWTHFASHCWKVWREVKQKARIQNVLNLCVSVDGANKAHTRVGNIFLNTHFLSLVKYALVIFMPTSYKALFELEVKAPWACPTSENAYLGPRANASSLSKAAVNCLLTSKTKLDGGFYLPCCSHSAGMNCRLRTMQGKDWFYTKQFVMSSDYCSGCDQNKY